MRHFPDGRGRPIASPGAGACGSFAVVCRCPPDERCAAGLAPRSVRAARGPLLLRRDGHLPGPRRPGRRVRPGRAVPARRGAGAGRRTRAGRRVAPVAEPAPVAESAPVAEPTPATAPVVVATAAAPAVTTGTDRRGDTDRSWRPRSQRWRRPSRPRPRSTRQRQPSVRCTRSSLPVRRAPVRPAPSPAAAPALATVTEPEAAARLETALSARGDRSGRRGIARTHGRPRAGAAEAADAARAAARTGRGRDRSGSGRRRPVRAVPATQVVVDGRATAEASGDGGGRRGRRPDRGRPRSRARRCRRPSRPRRRRSAGTAGRRRAAAGPAPGSRR